VDDFGVKYVGREHAEHLMACNKNNYNISSNWKGSAYCGLTLDWDYKNRTVDLSMPGYIKAALHKYQHAAPAFQNTRHTRGIHLHMAPKHNMWRIKQPAKHFPTKMKKNYSNLWARYYIMQGPLIQPLSMPINVLASEQSKATTVTADKVIKLLNYCNTRPETKIRYHASDMIIHIHSVASYHSEKESKSRAGRFFSMGSSNNTDKNSPTGTF
jgi:hypothetical protein